MPVEMQVFNGETYVHSQLLGQRPIMIGRAPVNDLVLASEQVSWHHVTVWVEGGRIWVKDLGSTNGTFIDGSRLSAVQYISMSSRVMIGTRIQLRFSGTIPDAEVPAVRPLVLVDEEHGLVFSPLGDRFFIGSGEHCDLVLGEGPEEAAVISIHEDGEAWVGTDEEERALAVGEALTVCGRTFVLRHATARDPTAVVDRTAYPIRVTVDLQGAAGPEALVEDLHSGKNCEIRAANRAVLLYILARRVKQDQEEGVIDSRRGWCTDEEVASGVWGRSWRSSAGSHLHVLIHRLRAQLKSAQMDPWFIEKKRRHTRIRVQDIIIRD